MKVSDLLYSETIKGNIRNAELVEIIQLCADFLNLKTPEEYAKEIGVSLQAVYKSGKPIKILNKNS